MGSLHAGHAALMHAARDRADLVVVTLFVNPLQFGPGEDFQRYPRDLDGDLRLSCQARADLVFAPDLHELVPPTMATSVEVAGLQDGLCGPFRPGHFRGVATIVTKLLTLTRPHVAVFGEKDYQQLTIVRRLVVDLGLDTEIVGHPIVREADGLAMSSRNAYLSPAERAEAVALYEGLRRAEALFAVGERRPAQLIATVRGALDARPLVRTQYIELRHAATLEPVAGVADGHPVVLALAAYVGATRLIDNVVLSSP
jgi:pantoate--beta-alanine ligase